MQNFNAPLDENALKLAGKQVFACCLKYGTSLDDTRERTGNNENCIGCDKVDAACPKKIKP